MGYRVVNGKICFVDNFPSVSNLQKEKKIRTSNFEEILNKEVSKEESFVISNHAKERLDERNIRFTEEDMKKINGAINKGKDKGCKECLILYKDVAMVANIKNRTIITAVNKENRENNVFTNIDGAILL